MGLFSNLLKSEFEKWVEGASQEELSKAYEEERQKWIREGYNKGTGERTASGVREYRWHGNPQSLRYSLVTGTESKGIPCVLSV